MEDGDGTLSARPRAPNNRTLTLDDAERSLYRDRLLRPSEHGPLDTEALIGRTVNADLLDLLDRLPTAFADLLVVDPPYNLAKDFHGLRFPKTDDDAYLVYLRSWLPRLLRTLKPSGSIYLCGDWRSSVPLYTALSDGAIIRNRITWQREKGRGAGANWKVASEDIWFATLSEDYYFDVEAVKQRRSVRAPYREDGQPKDWEETDDGRFRLTHPGNFWDDISVPFWSMPENTDHPTQKPEKLVAKLVLASCPPGGIVLDPFLGSGTTSVVARKLGRRYVGIEINEEYCLWAEKRLELATGDGAIQGYEDGVFWERNSARKRRPNGAAGARGGTEQDPGR